MMHMPTADIVKALDGLSIENRNMVINYILYLKELQISRRKKDVSKRFGIAKGKIQVPDDIDECNDEVAELFGI